MKKHQIPPVLKEQFLEVEVIGSEKLVVGRTQQLHIYVIPVCHNQHGQPIVHSIQCASANNWKATKQQNLKERMQSGKATNRELEGRGHILGQ